MLGKNVQETANDLELLIKLVEDGVIKPVMDRSYPFENIVDAHRYVDTGREKGNVAITVSHLPKSQAIASQPLTTVMEN